MSHETRRAIAGVASTAVNLAGALGLVAIATILCGGRGECADGKPQGVLDAVQGSGSMSKPAGDGGKGSEGTIPAPAAWDEGFPIPAGARRNDARGGATSIAPGKNFTMRVYDADDAIDAMSAFYSHHLSGAKRASAGREIRFSTPRGSVRLVPLDQGTRITLVIGPR